MLTSEYRKDSFLDESMLTRSINIMADQLERVYDPNSYRDIELDENLIGYLLDFNVIDKSTADNLRSSLNQSERFNILSDCLLNHNDFDYNNNSNSKQSSFLLVNALRQYGYHSLANKLDIGRRIIPNSAPDIFVNEIYNQSFNANPNERLRGQIRIWIQVSAIKIGENTLEAIKNALIENGELEQDEPYQKAPKEYLEVAQNDENVPFMRQISKTPNGLAYWIDLDFPRHHSKVIDCVKDCIEDENLSTKNNASTNAKMTDSKLQKNRNKSSSGCFLFFKKIFKKSKKQNKQEKNVIDFKKFSPDQRKNLANFNLPKEVIDILSQEEKTNISQIEETSKRDPLKEAKKQYLDEKSDLFYEKVNEIGSKYNDSIVKYFEQTLGVLFLGSCKLDSLSANLSDEYKPNQPSCLLISIIATKAETIKSLIKYSTSNSKDKSYPFDNSCKQFFLECKLALDLENVVKNSGILKLLDIEDIRLAIGWDRQETKKAFLELKTSRH